MTPTSYQLFLCLPHAITLSIGSLGPCTLQPGTYVYTGSAKKNFEARIARHALKTKKLHWHIDYIMCHPDTQLVHVHKSTLPECELNESIEGTMPVVGLGSSDYKTCKSHFKKIDDDVMKQVMTS